MSEEIIQLLVAHRDRLDRAIEALQGSTKPVEVYDDPTMPDWVKPKANVAPAPKKKGFSAATRRKMAEGQKRRYAAIRAAKAESGLKRKAPKIPLKVKQAHVDHSTRMKAYWAKKKTAKKGM